MAVLHKAITKKVLVILFVLFYAGAMFPQNEQQYSIEKNSASLGPVSGALLLEAPGIGSKTDVRNKLKYSFLLIKFNTGSDTYQYGGGTTNEAYLFHYRVTLRAKAYDSNGDLMPFFFDEDRFYLEINNNSVEAYFLKDLVNDIPLNYLNRPVSRIEVEVIGAVDDVLAGQSNLGTDKLELHASYSKYYAYDTKFVSGAGVPPPYKLGSRVNGKTVTLSFMHNYPYAHYQIELLKLNNKAEENEYSDMLIVPDYDWSRAMRFEVPVDAFDLPNKCVSMNKSAMMRISEGTGYYVWRARAIGSYYENGVANAENFGQWSEVTEYDEVGESLPWYTDEPYYFFFRNPEENRNTIYSRIFSEENKIKESIRYANGLLQARQDQVYLPSQDLTLISQTYYDKSGRPVLKTLPGPVSGVQDSYYEAFAKYHYHLGEDDYYNTFTDANINGEWPEMFQGVMSYYDGTGGINGKMGQRVPDAKGYPYTKTQYENSPLNRVREASGVGLAHSINPKNNGKTSKYYYDTPSERELVSIFGHEAPNHQKIAKTTVVDPNGVATVEYKNTEGQTIATCLVFNENNFPLEEIGGEPQVLEEFEHKVTKNTLIETGFQSSKRVVLAAGGNLKVNYRVDVKSLPPMCANVDVGDRFSVQFNLIDMQTNISYACKEVALEDRGTYLETLELSLPYDLEDIGEEENPYGAVNINDALPPGTYVVEKRLLVEEISDEESQDAEELVLQQISPLIAMMTSWLEGVNTTAELSGFYNDLYDLSVSINNYQLDVDYSDQLDVIEPGFIAYYLGNAQGYSMSFWDADNQEILELPSPDGRIPDNVHVGIPCCDNYTFPIKWVPPSPCEVEPAVSIDGNGDPAFALDFEAIGQEYLSSCAPDVNIYDYMFGWDKKGVFNLMVHHMLTDEYIEIESDPVATPQVQYSCDELYDCWISALEDLKLELCDNIDRQDNSQDTEGGISGAFSQVNEGTSEEGEAMDMDGYMNDEFGKGDVPADQVSDINITDEIENAQNPENNPNALPNFNFVHLVDKFLDCAGYKFAKILTNFDPIPLESDKSEQFDYQRDNIDPYTDSDEPEPKYRINYFPPVIPIINIWFTDNNIFYFTIDKHSGYDFYYKPIANWPMGLGDASSYDYDENRRADLLKFIKMKKWHFIKNPVYAFKYLSYPKEGQKKYGPLENSVCFDDPNTCYPVTETRNGVDLFDKSTGGEPCCAVDGNTSFCYDDGQGNLLVENFCGLGRVKCEKTHRDWDFYQKNIFFDMLQNYVPPEDDYDGSDAGNFDCQSYQVKENWWINNTGLEGYPRYVNESDKGAIENETGQTLTAFDQWMEWPFFEGYQYEDDKVSMVEILTARRNNDCLEACENRRPFFKDALLNLLEEKCYVIQDCNSGLRDDVWPRKAVEGVIDQLVANCKSQCSINTFSCSDEGCRLLNEHLTEFGSSVDFPMLSVGVGGRGHINDDAYLDEDCVELTDIPSLKQCELGLNVNVYDYSWQQYTLSQQAMAWWFELELEDKCLLPDQVTPRNEPMNFEASSADTDTFMEKDEYEISGQMPDDPFNQEEEEVVKSPAKLIRAQ